MKAQAVSVYREGGVSGSINADSGQSAGLLRAKALAMTENSTLTGFADCHPELDSGSINADFNQTDRFRIGVRNDVLVEPAESRHSEGFSPKNLSTQQSRSSLRSFANAQDDEIGTVGWAYLPNKKGSFAIAQDDEIGETRRAFARGGGANGTGFAGGTQDKTNVIKINFGGIRDESIA